MLRDMDQAPVSAPALAIVTGGSRGLGLAMVTQLARQGHRVLSLARQHGSDTPVGVETWSVDLADPVPVAERLQQWLTTQTGAGLGGAWLINNAGVVSTPAPLSLGNLAELSRAVRVGLEAALLLSSAFLAATADWPVPRKLLLISSGLGRRAMAGSASYCAAKAGMDHLARAVALEEAAKPNGARVVSLAPGVFDTDMQVQLRSADPLLFPERSTFMTMKTAGNLDSPAAAAAKVLGYLAREDFGSKPVGDVRDP